MATSNEQLLTCLKDLEFAAEDVLADRQEIVDLDRRRLQNREALRAADELCKSHWKGEEAGLWLAAANCFFKLPVKSAKKIMQKDQVQLDSKVNVLRSDLKVKVNRLHELEGRPEVKGFGLVALSRDEMEAVSQTIGPRPNHR